MCCTFCAYLNPGITCRPSVVMPGVQVVIMVTPLSTFFKVEYQDWKEWLFAIALGAGSLLMAAATKSVSRFLPAIPCNYRPKANFRSAHVLLMIAFASNVLCKACQARRSS